MDESSKGNGYTIRTFKRSEYDKTFNTLLSYSSGPSNSSKQIFKTFNTYNLFSRSQESNSAQTAEPSWKYNILKATMERAYCIAVFVIQLTAVPYIRHLRAEKERHNEALKVLKYICKEVREIDDDNVIREHYTEALLIALDYDNSEAIEEIIRSFPQAIWTRHHEYHLTQLAVPNRCKNVYNYLVHGDVVTPR
ncbi:hypothetical protein Tco_0541212 [Tanacetum coccineum]